MASRSWWRRWLEQIDRLLMNVGIIGLQAFRFSGGEQVCVSSDKHQRRFFRSHEACIQRQSASQLHSIVTTKRIAPDDIHRLLNNVLVNRYNHKIVCGILKKIYDRQIKLLQLYCSRPRFACQRGGNFRNCNLGNAHHIARLGVCKRIDPCRTPFCDVVFDQCAAIKKVEHVLPRAALFNDDFAYRLTRNDKRLLSGSIQHTGRQQSFIQWTRHTLLGQ